MQIGIFDAKIQSAEARSRCYAFLSYVYVPLPGEDFMTKIMDNSNYALFRSSTSGVAGLPDEKKQLEQGLKTVEHFLKQAGGKAQDDLLQSMAVERTRLFRGIKRDYGPPPPYGSVYIEGDLVMNKSTSQVRKVYASFDYDIPEDGGEMPDFISVELDFMGHLCNNEAEAWQQENETLAQAFLTGERQFLHGHLLQWIPKFCDEVIRWSNQAFYRGMAQVTNGFLMIDGERFTSEKGA